MLWLAKTALQWRLEACLSSRYGFAVAFQNGLSSVHSRDEHAQRQTMPIPGGVSSSLSAPWYDIPMSYVFNSPFCHARRRYVACQHGFLLVVDLILDVAVSGSCHDSASFSAKFDYERPAAVSGLLFPYRENWQLFNECSWGRVCLSHSSSQ